MTLSLTHIFIVLIIGILSVVLLTTRFRFPAFFALGIACFLVGLGTFLPFSEIITSMKEGFGNTMKSLGFIIVLGTTLGLILEHTGATTVMANYIVAKVGHKHSALAIAITGFVVGLPIFCDSGYIVLSGLNKSLVRKAGLSKVVMSVSLASGLYSVHCLVPPHPGATAAAGIIGVEYGKLILYGIIIAIPAMFTGYLWANYFGRKFVVEEAIEDDELITPTIGLPSVLRSFLPIVVPIALLAMKSFLLMESNPLSLKGAQRVLSAVGDPVVALLIGVLLAFNCKKSWTKETASTLLSEAVEKAGSILIIIGAGGAFGAVLQATKIGEHFHDSLPLTGMGILFPFLLSSILKTAIGSSTVSIVTAASIVLPLLTVLGLDSEIGRLLCVLAMGAGSMMISHANDAYFWVISRFSGIEMKNMLRVYTVATVLMGLISFSLIYVLNVVAR